MFLSNLKKSHLKRICNEYFFRNRRHICVKNTNEQLLFTRDFTPINVQKHTHVTIVSSRSFAAPILQHARAYSLSPIFTFDVM